MAKQICKICIYPKDVQRIMGKSYRQARLYLSKIRKDLGKQPKQLISIREFSQYTGLPLEDIIATLL
ncbi:hypothetical protein HUK80_13345 [Flavobacterium sp. MAH-1]|uniref:Uncharacterized protein n=1 Tax=Flavobacterium agri TaxID=2743471 RepID=A0A7Y8Y3M5_9FLAO|nr:hypothetical protein [Flavobacterium agri]NUY81883.1 hypothetical protein [Flavobacterium agri]NYA71907.1 hypothetical protein [Flavobacterium agri]